MLSKHLILADSVKAPRDLNPYASNSILSLYGEKPNVIFEKDDIWQSLLIYPQKRWQDLLDLACYVYAADQMISRGPLTAIDNGDSWRRDFHFILPVRDLDFWNQRQVQQILTHTLNFLTDDIYQFTFQPAAKSQKTPNYLEYGKSAWSHVEEVLLFSGGLDSLAGVVESAVVQQKQVLMVHHRSTTKVSKRVQGLVEQLQKKLRPGQLDWLRIRIYKDSNLTQDYTQRSRSFLYACLGATISHRIGLKQLHFNENGILSLHLPLASQLIGSKATRTTHPLVLNGFSQLFSLIAEQPFTVQNPFLWKTKTEVVQAIANAGCADLIEQSVSCVHTHQQSNDRPHCGVCSQCIDRRFAILAAKQETHDPAECYKVDLFLGERSGSNPQTMLALYVEMANRIHRMNFETFLQTFGEVARVLSYLQRKPDAVALRIYQLYQRHSQQVIQVIQDGIVRYASRMIERTLPPSCLLSLVTNASGQFEQVVPISPSPLEIDLNNAAANVFRQEGLPMDPGRFTPTSMKLGNYYLK